MIEQAPPKSDSAPSQGFRRWAGRGVWGLLDQGLFAGASFALQVALIGWLAPEQFGAFTAAYAVVMYIGVCHTALLTEPMSIFGADKYLDRLPDYLGQLVRGHLAVCATGMLGMLIVAAGAWTLNHPLLAWAMFSCAWGLPLILLPWMLRPACYLESRPDVSAVGGMVYLLAVFALLITIAWAGRLSVPSAVIALALSAGLSAVYMLARLGVRPRHIWPAHRLDQVWPDHWRFGKWALPGGLTRAVPEQLPYLVVPALLGLAQGGALKALLHFAMPLILAIWTVSSLLVPLLVRRLHTPGFNRLALGMLACAVGPPLVCWPLLGGFGPTLMNLLYQGQFIEYAPMLWLVGAIPVLIGIDATLHARLRAAERPDLLLYGAVVAAGVLILAGGPLLLTYGLGGVLIALILSYSSQCVTLWFIGRGVVRRAGAPSDSTVEDSGSANTAGRYAESGLPDPDAALHPSGSSPDLAVVAASVTGGNTS